MLQKSNSTRQLKVSNLIKLSLNSILKKGRSIDQKLMGDDLVITDVKISSDLKIAKCYFVLYPISKYSKEEIIEAFEESSKSLRKQVTQAINLKFSPELRFYFDSGYENSIEVDKILLNITPKTE